MMAGEMSLEAAKSRPDSGLPARPGSYSGTVSITTLLIPVLRGTHLHDSAIIPIVTKLSLAAHMLWGQTSARDI